MPTRTGPAAYIVLLSVLALVVAGHVGGQALRAQQHPSTITAGLETIQIRPNVYVIFGAGANVTVHVGEDGLVLVDSGSTEMADTLLKAVKSISPRRVRLIINTSADVDHVGGNAVIGGSRYSAEPRPVRPRESRDRARPRERAAAHERADGKSIAFSHEDVADRDIHVAIPVDLCQ